MTLAFSIIQIGLWALVAFIDPKNDRPFVFFSLYLTTFFFYYLSCRKLWSKNFTLSISQILIFGLLFRIILLPSEPSDDINRYLFEGKIQSEGFNPYLTPPNSVVIKHLAEGDPYFKSINHPEWTAIYFPFQLLLHRVLASTFYSPLSFKIFFLFMEGLMVFFLLAMLRNRNHPPSSILLYWWNPLAIISVALEGHLEIVFVSFIMMGLYFLMGNKKGWALIFLTLSLGSKPFGIIHAPLFLKELKVRHLVSMVILAFIITYPFHKAGVSVLDSLLRFGKEASYNDSLHWLLELVALPFFGEGPLRSRFLAIFGLLLSLFHIHKKYSVDTLKSAFFSQAALLLFLPTVHPWYFLALLPYLCFFPSRSWIFLSGSLSFLYLNYININKTGMWSESILLKVLAYSPLIFYLGFNFYKKMNLKKSTLTPKKGVF